MTDRIKVALICNQRIEHNDFEMEYDPEHTIASILQALNNYGYDTVFINASSPDLVSRLIEEKPDIVFNRSEGFIYMRNRESLIPAILESLQIPFVGADVLGTAIGQNKKVAKTLASSLLIPTPQDYFLDPYTLDEILDQLKQDLEKGKTSFPFVLKPVYEGSSFGIKLVYTFDDLFTSATDYISKTNKPILLEEFIAGDEYSVGLIGNGKELKLLPYLRIKRECFTQGDFIFDSHAKSHDSLEYYECPSHPETHIDQHLREYATILFRSLYCFDFARIDFRIKDGKLYFLEVNPLPGLDYHVSNNDISFYPFMAVRGGYTFDSLIHAILLAAIKRYPDLYARTMKVMPKYWKENE